MSSFLETVRKSDNERRYYVGGCRVSRHIFNSVGDGNRYCFQTIDKVTHWHYRHERKL